jgi:hypothetical protein
MALDFQPVQVDLTGGADTRTAKPLVIPGKLTALENAVMRGGTIYRRDGYQGFDTQGDTNSPGLTLTGGAALARFKQELLMWSAGMLWGRVHQSASVDKWATRGSSSDAVHYTLRRTPLFAGRTNATSMDAAVDSNTGTVAYTWREDLPGGTAYNLRAALIDQNGAFQLNAPIAQNLPNTGYTIATLSGPRVVALGGTFYFFWVDAGALKGWRWTSGAFVGSPTTLRTGLAVNALDAVASSTDVVVACANTTGVDLVRVSSSMVGTYVATTTHGSVTGVALARDSAGRFLLAYASDSASKGAYLYPMDANLALLGADTLVLGTASAPSGLALGSKDGTSHYLFVWQNTAASPIHRATVTAPGGITSAAAVWRYHLAPAAHPFTLSGRCLLPVTTRPSNAGDDVMPTALVLDADTGDVAARTLDGLAGGPGLLASYASSPTPDVPHVAVLLALTAFVPMFERGRLTFEHGDASTTPINKTPVGLSGMTLAYAAPAALSRVELGDVLHVAGACPMAYDGLSLVEEGYHLLPQRLSATVAATGGALGTGTYQYQAIYEWSDGQGRLQRSAPSPALSVTIASGTTNKVTLTGNHLPLTRKGSFTPAVVIHLYRTEADGVLFYRASSVSTPTQNSTFGDTWSIVDTLADGDILGTELLYTTGGRLPALPPPAHRFACAHQNRLWLGGLANPYAFAYSLEAVPGEALVFHDALTGEIPQHRGELTAVASMDGKALLFAQRGIFCVTGDGPNALGEANGYSLPQDLGSDVGCSDWRSVVEVPQGLLFVSDRGVHLLTRGLQVQSIGADLEGLLFPAGAAAYTCTRALVMEGPLKPQARLHFSPVGADDRDATSFCAVLDTEAGQWSTFTGMGALDAVVYSGAHYVLKTSTGSGYWLLAQSAGRRGDADGSNFNWAATTGWLNLGLRQGYQRVRRLLLLGEASDNVGTWTVKVEVAFDYEDAFSEVVSAQQIGALVQLRHRLGRQTCQAVRLRLTDNAALLGSGSVVQRLTNLTLEVGGKPGTRRLPAGKTV